MGKMTGMSIWQITSDYTACDCEVEGNSLSMKGTDGVATGLGLALVLGGMELLLLLLVLLRFTL